MSRRNKQKPAERTLKTQTYTNRKRTVTGEQTGSVVSPEVLLQFQTRPHCAYHWLTNSAPLWNCQCNRKPLDFSEQHWMLQHVNSSHFLELYSHVRFVWNSQRVILILWSEGRRDSVAPDDAVDDLRFIDPDGRVLQRAWTQEDRM